MDVMRKAIYMLSVLCVAALWGGCQRGGGEEGTAEVTLRFATRADGTDGTDPNALPNEGIKTLRVILYKAGEDGVYSFYPKSVIRISQCCMAMRNPLISPRWTGKTVLFLKTLPDRGYACPLFCPNKPVLRLTRIG